MRATPTRRDGFTLIELIVVITIIIAITAIVALVANSGLISNHRTVAGADELAKVLLVARSSALRDRAPKGVRFILDPANPNVARELQYIEVPDEYFPFPNDPANQVRLTIVKGGGGANDFVQVDGPPAAMTDLLTAVTAGDVLSLPGFNTLHRLSGNPTGTTTITIPVDTTKLPDIGGPGTMAAPQKFTTTSFSFQRQARPTLGLEPLLINGSAVVDFSADPVNKPTSLLNATGGNLDVLFAPTGQVIKTSQGVVVLWVRDPDYPHPRVGGASPDSRAAYEAAGQMILVCINCRSGSVSEQPVTLPAAGTSFSTRLAPHAAAFDGKNSGL